MFLFLGIKTDNAYAQATRQDCLKLPGLPCLAELTEETKAKEEHVRFGFDKNENGIIEPDERKEQQDLPNPNSERQAPNKEKAGPINSVNDIISFHNTCDSDFMNRILAKSVMESERHSIMAQTILRKPDSVLEYTCYDQMASLVADKGGPLFTESKEWDNKRVDIVANKDNPVAQTGEMPNRQGTDIQNIDRDRPVFINTYMEDDRLDKAVEEVVFKSLEEYLKENFKTTDQNHLFLGGEMPLNFQRFPIKVKKQAYNCSRMRQVYDFAKCNNFGEEDKFFSLAYLADENNDPRIYPRKCETDGGQSMKGGFINDDTLELYQDPGFKFSSFAAQSDNYFNKMEGGQCGFKIPTGLSVVIETDQFDGEKNRTDTDKNEFQEYICSNPGCYYDQGSCSQ